MVKSNNILSQYMTSAPQMICTGDKKYEERNAQCIIFKGASKKGRRSLDLKCLFLGDRCICVSWNPSASGIRHVARSTYVIQR